MDFYVSRKGVDGLRRSNCESSDRAGEAPEWYTAWLQGKLLRLSVSCDDGGVEGYLYFVWSRPQTEGTTDEGNQITAFKCKGGRAVAVSSIGGGNDDEESGEEDGGDGSGTDDEAEEPTKTKPAVPVDPYTPGPEAEAMPAVMPTDAGAPTDVSTDTPIVLLATPMPLGSGPADSGAAPEDEDDDSSPSDGAKPLAIPVVAGSGDGDGTDTSQAAPKVGQGDDPSVPTPTAIEDSTGDPVPVAAPAGADHPPCPTLPVTTNGRCGEDYGARCPDGFCCSAWGWCQDDGGEDSADWCGPGCQIGFGKCFYQGPVADVCRSAREFTMTSVSASTTVYAACTTMPESKDGRCGRNAGTRCADGTCCSQWGWCQNNGENDGQAWCGDGCQVGYGKCFMGHGVPPRDFVCPTGLEPTPTEYSLTWVSKSTPVYMACTGVPLSGDGRCGKNTGTRCREGTCCSEWGYCQDDGGDSGESWCGTGCQLGFGKCFVGTAPLRTDFACPSSAPAEPTSGDWAPTRISRATPVYQACPTIPVSEDGRCGKEFGTRCPAGICCSQWGWCQDDGGDSGVSWCGAGCQVRQSPLNAQAELTRVHN
ncbi:hypothetical protein DFJ74DRAFT_661546 [Hyaloraphidium curvatum]|nr:hypothetical protein DFJ74DRAFT_661546 [Hyaloraphidium curvatum]